VDEIVLGEAGLTGSMVDAGAPAVFLPADQVGIDLSSMTDPLSTHLPRLIRARSAAAVQMGIRRPEDPPQNAVPKVGVVAPAGDYIATDGAKITAESHDVRVRMLSMLAPHPAIGLTSAVAVSLASALPGTVVAEAARLAPLGTSASGLLRIGTPAGVITAEVTTDGSGNVSEVALHRAARQLAIADIDVAQPVAQTA
jgi:2-methylaconitate cis-trans-isomerase PrpF